MSTTDPEVQCGGLAVPALGAVSREAIKELDPGENFVGKGRGAVATHSVWPWGRVMRTQMAYRSYLSVVFHSTFVQITTGRGPLFPQIQKKFANFRPRGPVTWHLAWVMPAGMANFGNFPKMVYPK